MAVTVLTWATGDTRGVMEFDAVETEVPSVEVAITEYPIELGANITDHIRAKPATMRITAIVSNIPARSGPLAGPAGSPRQTGLGFMGDMSPTTELTMRVRQPLINTPPAWQIRSSIAGIPLTRDVTMRAVVRTWSPDGQPILRVKNIFDELRQGMSEGREYTIATEMYGDFEQMLLKSIHTTRDGKSGNSARLELEFQQVFYAQLSQRDVTHLLPVKPKKKRSEPPKPEPKKETEEATEADRSFFYGITGGY